MMLGQACTPAGHDTAGTELDSEHFGPDASSVETSPPSIALVFVAPAPSTAASAGLAPLAVHPEHTNAAAARANAKTKRCRMQFSLADSVPTAARDFCEKICTPVVPHRAGP